MSDGVRTAAVGCSSSLHCGRESGSLARERDADGAAVGAECPSVCAASSGVPRGRGLDAGACAGSLLGSALPGWVCARGACGQPAVQGDATARRRMGLPGRAVDCWRRLGCCPRVDHRRDRGLARPGVGHRGALVASVALLGTRCLAIAFCSPHGGGPAPGFTTTEAIPEALFPRYLPFWQIDSTISLRPGEEAPSSIVGRHVTFGFEWHSDPGSLRG